jgi:hypothetical protein
MVYHPPSKSILLFGGADEAKVYGDTWRWSAGKWGKIPVDGPSPRTFPALVMTDTYILLFGGNAVLFGSDQNPVHHLADTWKFQDGHWSEVAAAIHPDARAEAAIGYDPIRKKVVLFGGRQAGEQWVAGDTWEFDGNHWQRLDVPGPTARSGAVMTYDEKRKQVVLFGGNPVIAKEKGYNGAMWSWDGHRWHAMNAAVPLIFNACMAYNRAEDSILRFGGWDGQQRVNDTWLYQHNIWQKLPLKVAPAARNHSSMVYDSENKAFFLYGGHNGEQVFGDLWCFKDQKWTLLLGEPPRKHVENGH